MDCPELINISPIPKNIYKLNKIIKNYNYTCDSKNEHFQTLLLSEFTLYPRKKVKTNGKKNIMMPYDPLSINVVLDFQEKISLAPLYKKKSTENQEMLSLLMKEFKKLNITPKKIYYEHERKAGLFIPVYSYFRLDSDSDSDSEIDYSDSESQNEIQEDAFTKRLIFQIPLFSTHHSTKCPDILTAENISELLLLIYLCFIESKPQIYYKYSDPEIILNTLLKLDRYFGYFIYFKHPQEIERIFEFCHSFGLEYIYSGIHDPSHSFYLYSQEDEESVDDDDSQMVEVENHLLLEIKIIRGSGKIQIGFDYLASKDVLLNFELLRFFIKELDKVFEVSHCQSIGIKKSKREMTLNESLNNLKKELLRSKEILKELNIINIEPSEIHKVIH